MAVDIRQAKHFIKEVLKGGTPGWISRPWEYRSMVDEFHREAAENLMWECRFWHIDEQISLADPAGRRVNIMTAAEFMKNLRSAGLTCFSHDSTLQDHTASLFVLMPTVNGGEFKPVCSIQVPLMWEWSLIRLDPRTGLVNGFRDIGWRSAVRCLIMMGALGEERAYEIFGRPRISRVSLLHRRHLYEYRNGKDRKRAA